MKKKYVSGTLIEIRDISLSQAKDEMLDLLSDKKTRYFDEIADALKIDIKLVVEAFKELNAEKKLFVDEQ